MMNEQFQIPPNAVHVWRGFRDPMLSQQNFSDRLGQTFVPTTVDTLALIEIITFKKGETNDKSNDLCD
jgi:hypothetical protein